MLAMEDYASFNKSQGTSTHAMVIRQRLRLYNNRFQPVDHPVWIAVGW